jgi:hypothetical protein
MNYSDVKTKIKAAYNATLPASIRYDPNFTDKQKLFYAELTASMNHLGYCEYENIYFAEILGVSKRTITRFLAELSDRGYIALEFLGNGERRITFPIHQVGFIQPPRIKNKMNGVSEEELGFINTFLEEWEKALDCKLYAKKNYLQVVLARLENFSEEELVRARDNRIDFVKNSPWHQVEENKRYKNDITILLRDDQSVLKSLQMNTSNKSKKSSLSFNIDKADKNLLD